MKNAIPPLSERLEQAQLSARSVSLLGAELRRADAWYAGGEAIGRRAICLAAAELEYELTEYNVGPLSPVSPEDRFGYSGERIERNRHQLQTVGRERARRELTALVPKNEEEAARREDWLSQVDQLDLGELITYQAYSHLSTPVLTYPGANEVTPERCAKQPDKIEFRFGQGRYQQGYYDSYPTFELRFWPVRIRSLISRYREVTNTFTGIARRYGVEFKHYTPHGNASFWVLDPEGSYRLAHNLHDPEGAEQARLGAAGIVRAQAIAAPVQYPAGGFSGPRRYAASPSRETSLRVLPGRYEQRYGPASEAGIAMTGLTIMGGYAAGVNRPDAVVPPTAIRRIALFEPGPGFVRDEHLDVLRIAQYASVAENGRLYLNEAYARQSATDILSTLINLKFDFGYGSNVEDELEALIAPVIALVSCIRLSGNALQLDEAEYDRWWQEHGDWADRLQRGVTRELTAGTMRERIHTVRLASFGTGVESEGVPGPPNPLGWHRAMEQFLEAPEFKVISDRNKRRIQRELDTFSQEEVLAEEAFKLALHLSGEVHPFAGGAFAEDRIDAPRKVADWLTETLAAYPEANPEACRTHLNAKLLDKMLALFNASPTQNRALLAHYRAIFSRLQIA